MPGGGNDPFADAEADNQQKDLVHIRVQQRNGRKCISSVQGLDAELDFKKILKAIPSISQPLLHWHEHDLSSALSATRRGSATCG